MAGIIIFALVAVFLGLRLYSVLGKRTGHEQGFGQAEETRVSSIPGAQLTDGVAEKPAQVAPVEPVAEAGATAGLRAIGAADRSFSPEGFVEGAGSAYRIILEAFWKGDLSEVDSFIAADVRDAFADVIAARTAAGEVLDNRLIGIDRAVISSASLEGGTAQIVVRFDADIAAVTRNSEGVVIAGSLTDAVPTHDAWTFSREMRSSDPNWILTDTDEAS